MAGGQQRMCGSPGLYATFRNGKSFRKIIQILECVGNLHAPADAVADCAAEDIFEFLLYNKYNFLKTGFAAS